MKRIDSLTGLRGLACFLVVLTHAVLDVDEVGFYGRIAVNLFFILSGHVMALSYASCQFFETIACRYSFWRRRVARIMPLYWVGLIFSISDDLCPSSIAWTFNDIMTAILTPFMLQNLVMGHSIRWMRVGWSLVVESAGYLMFPFVMKHPKYFFLFSLMTVIYLPSLLIGRSVKLDNDYYFAVSTRVWEFVLAASFTKLVSDQIIRIPEPFSSRWVDLPPLIAILTMFILPPIPHVYLRNVLLYFTCGWFSPLSLLLIYCLSSDNSRVGRLLSHPFCIWAGDISFAAYILHMPLQGYTRDIVSYFEFGLIGQIYSIIAMFVFLSLISHLVHNLFEVPITRYLNKTWSMKCDCGVKEKEVNGVEEGLLANEVL